MRLINLSAEPVGRLHSWIPRGLHAERIVFLPDACPGKSPLPTGTAVLTRQDNPRRFDLEFDRVVSWAADNRAAIHAAINQVFGKVDLVLDLPHNTFEVCDDGAVFIRKGSVHVRPGDLSILPSHMSGDVVLVRATSRVDEVLYSISHGTGRKMSRSDCKPLADTFDFAALRQRIIIPTGVEDSSLRTDGPFAYRDLDECLALLTGYVEPVQRFSVIGYMGHL